MSEFTVCELSLVKLFLKRNEKLFLSRWYDIDNRHTFEVSLLTEKMIAGSRN